jgi:HEPN domain-containing protein
MSLIDDSDDEAVVEECIAELEELVMTLDRYPAAAVAVAISTYLEGLLGALLDEGRCTVDEVRELLREIESGVIEPGLPDDTRIPTEG